MNIHDWRWIPNALTFLRVLLIFPFAAALLEGSYRLSLLIFFVAAATDGFDGFLARHFNWYSRVGAIADPLADKALLVSAYLMLTLTGILPLWLFALVLGRDLAIVGGALVYHYRVGRYQMKPSAPGKVNTFVQVLVVLAIMILLAGFPMPVWVVDAGIWLVAVSAVFSGGHYILVWSRRAWRARRS